MQEPQVVQRVHRFLQQFEREGEEITRLYTDAHHTLVGIDRLRPFQRFRLDLGNRVVHPDLVGQLNDGETLLAVEAKEENVTKGLAQAQHYQEGFHLSFLAADRTALGRSTLRLARRQRIGLIGVKEDIEIVHWPLPRQPWRDPARSIRRQMEAAGEAIGHRTFLYNLPTHYLAWVVALAPNTWYDEESLPERVGAYPMPKDWKGAVRGARQLGLLETDGDRARLTPTGASVKEILDTPLDTWAEVHQRAKRAPLVDHEPRAAAALRLLVMRDLMARLIVEGLKRFSDRRATFDQLARACSKLDYDRSTVLFFIPERIEEVMDRQGQIQWDEVKAKHYRPTTSYQYKSILKHAGIIEDTGLGGSTPPEEDVWVLRL